MNIVQLKQPCQHPKPHRHALAAKWLFPARFKEQQKSEMDFWEALPSKDQQRVCLTVLFILFGDQPQPEGLAL